MTQIAYSGLFGGQFRVSRDLFTDLAAGKATVRTFLPRLLTAASRILNYTHRKIITYQTPQSNLPNEATLNAMGKINWYLPTAKTQQWANRVHILGNVSYLK